MKMVDILNNSSKLLYGYLTINKKHRYFHIPIILFIKFIPLYGQNLLLYLVKKKNNNKYNKRISK